MQKPGVACRRRIDGPLDRGGVERPAIADRPVLAHIEDAHPTFLSASATKSFSREEGHVARLFPTLFLQVTGRP
jgi:hypothetical protein